MWCRLWSLLRIDSNFRTACCGKNEPYCYEYIQLSVCRHIFSLLDKAMAGNNSLQHRNSNLRIFIRPAPYCHCLWPLLPRIRSIHESSKVPVISSVEAVVAALIGVLLYHERLNVFGVSGIALVLASIAVMNITNPKYIPRRRTFFPSKL